MDLVDVYRLLFIVDDFKVSGLVFVVSGLEPAKCERCKIIVRSALLRTCELRKVCS